MLLSTKVRVILETWRFPEIMSYYGYGRCREPSFHKAPSANDIRSDIHEEYIYVC